MPCLFRHAWLSLALLATLPISALASAPSPVAAAVEQLLRARTANWPGQAVISVDAEAVARLAPCDAAQPFLAPNARLRNRMSVGVRCTSPSAWTGYVQANISIPGNYPVAQRDIAAGTMIAEADLTSRQGDLLALPTGAVRAAEQAVGNVAARRIRAGQVLRHNVLRDAQAVRRGQQVRLVVNGAGFVATSAGQAMSGAAPGTMVQVRTASGQRVSGIVRDANTVEVMM